MPVIVIMRHATDQQKFEKEKEAQTVASRSFCGWAYRVRVRSKGGKYDVMRRLSITL
jgi:hypothetical protein